MADNNCETCKLRSKYDTNPKSFLGRIWRWHTNWCPGWKSYITSLAEEDRKKLAGKYDMKKYQ